MIPAPRPVSTVGLVDVEQITASWLGEILATEVAAIEVERIGDGLVGMNLRVRLVGAPEGAPGTVVIKLPSPDPVSRATGIGLRNYEREVKFYLEIAPTVDIRVPRCHHGEWDEASGDFVLVLEDMAPAVQGDQITGCDLDHARAAVAELARLHGPRWDDATLWNVDWLGRRTSDEDALQLKTIWSMMLPGFLVGYSKYLDTEMIELIERFGPALEAWVNDRVPLYTVTHGDYRLDNLLFLGNGASTQVTAVDWQTPGHGPGSADLSYFCGAGLTIAERRAEERTLVDRYLEGLDVYGVSVEEASMWDAYRRDAFAGVIMSVVASQIVGGTERSEAMFAAMATRHSQHCLDLDSYSLI